MRHVDIDIKEACFDGCFSGYASVFDVKDQQNDVIKRGAFKKSIAMMQSEKILPRMLWQHDISKPIGIWKHMTEDAYGLFVRGELCLASDFARGVYALICQGAVKHLSIGYRIEKARHDSLQKAKIIEEVDLLEVSVVTFASNALARIHYVQSTH